MGFGTESQIGNRTSLADIFRNNIGAPQQVGTTQQPNQLFTLLQSLMGGQGGQPGALPPEQFGGRPGSPPQFGGLPGIKPPQGGIPILGDPQITPPQPGGTALSAITAQPPQIGGGTGIGGGGTGLTNPFGNLINQRFTR